jgi:hypothetical protein
MVQKNLSIVFSYNLSAGTLFSIFKKKFLGKNYLLQICFASIISVRPTPYDPGAQKHADPDPQHWADHTPTVLRVASCFRNNHFSESTPPCLRIRCRIFSRMRIQP